MKDSNSWERAKNEASPATGPAHCLTAFQTREQAEGTQMGPVDSLSCRNSCASGKNKVAKDGRIEFQRGETLEMDRRPPPVRSWGLVNTCMNEQTTPGGKRNRGKCPRHEGLRRVQQGQETIIITVFHVLTGVDVWMILKNPNRTSRDENNVWD